MNHFATTKHSDNKHTESTGADPASGADPRGPHHDVARGPIPEKLTEPSRQADARQSETDPSYPRYVFRIGTGRVQGDTGAFTAESMIVHRPEEFQSLLSSGIWARSPAEAGMSVDAIPDKKKDEAKT